MSNSASLLLPGSNLTNLLVLSREHINGIAFARQMLPSWIAACLLTITFLAVVFPLDDGHGADNEFSPPLRLGVGAASALIAAALILLLPNPAIPVLALGLIAIMLRRLPAHINAPALALLFAFTVALGTIARAWHDPAETPPTRAVGQPPPSLRSVRAWSTTSPPPSSSRRNHHHTPTLFSSDDLGPNLVITGSLSAYLWLQAAKTANARASIRTYSRLGLLLVPLTLAAALGALSTGTHADHPRTSDSQPSPIGSSTRSRHAAAPRSDRRQVDQEAPPARGHSPGTLAMIPVVSCQVGHQPGCPSHQEGHHDQHQAHHQAGHRGRSGPASRKPMTVAQITEAALPLTNLGRQDLRSRCSTRSCTARTGSPTGLS